MFHCHITDGHEQTLAQCATLYLANKQIEDAPTSHKQQNRTWYPGPCYPKNTHKVLQLTYEQWASLAATPESIRIAANQSLVPQPVVDKGSTDLALWVLSRNMGDYKSLDAYDGSFSLLLYQHAHYVYAYGIGESFLVEILAIVLMSFFIFYTSFLSESQQLLHQINLSSGMRCYESNTGACAMALRTAIRKRLQQGPLHALKTYGFLVISDAVSDIFIALRIIFLTMMLFATIFFTTMNHGSLHASAKPALSQLTSDEPFKFGAVTLTSVWFQAQST